ncbi:MAG: DNRLRE domain-containing protein [bacterium]
MPRQILLAVLAALAVCALAGCSQKESFSPDIYGDLAPDSLFDSIDTAASTEASAGLGAAADSLWASRQMVVSNWRGRRAMSFVRFSALPESTVEITRASLFLYARRIQSDGAAYQFGIYTLATALNETTLTWTARPDLEDRVAVFSLGSSGPDAMAEDSVIVDLTSLVSGWVSAQDSNFGLAIKLEDEGGSRVIAEFATAQDPTTRDRVADSDTTDFQVWPHLKIDYIEDSDTSYIEALATQDVFAASLDEPLPDTLLACGNGFPTRAFVAFDLADVPREASVARAEIKLNVDLASSSFDEITVACYGLVSPIGGFKTAHGSTYIDSEVMADSSVQSDQAFSFDVTVPVQALVSKQVENYGFVFESLGEDADLDFVVFQSAMGGRPDLAPRLEVYYTLPPPPRYEKD